MGSPALYISILYSSIKKEKIALSDNDWGLNIVIDSSSIDSAAIIDFVRNFNYRFIFSLSATILNDPLVDSIFSKLYTIFCLSSCVRRDPLCIPLLKDGPDTNARGMEALKEYFSGQGEPSLEFACFSGNGEAQIINSFLFCSMDLLMTLNEPLFSKINQEGPATIIIVPDREKKVVEEMASGKNLPHQNQYARMLFEFTNFRLEVNDLRKQNNLWRIRSALYLSFISLSKKVGENQYYDIVDWYAKEYEVLPLWYKRFGHIIKWMTGKKSFKSLTGYAKKG